MFAADIDIPVWTKDMSVHCQSGSSNSCCALSS